MTSYHVQEILRWIAILLISILSSFSFAVWLAALGWLSEDMAMMSMPLWAILVSLFLNNVNLTRQL